MMPLPLYFVIVRFSTTTLLPEYRIASFSLPSPSSTARRPCLDHADQADVVLVDVDGLVIRAGQDLDRGAGRGALHRRLYRFAVLHDDHRLACRSRHGLDVAARHTCLHGLGRLALGLEAARVARSRTSRGRRRWRLVLLREIHPGAETCQRQHGAHDDALVHQESPCCCLPCAACATAEGSASGEMPIGLSPEGTAAGTSGLNVSSLSACRKSTSRSSSVVSEFRVPDMPVRLHRHAGRDRVAAPAGVEGHRLAQRGEAARVHVRRGLRHVAQRGHLEGALELRRTEGLLRAHVQRPALGLRRAQHRDLLVGEQWRRVAFGAARHEGAEHVHALDLARAQRLVITLRVAVVAAVERDQRGLERRERGVDVIERDGFGARGKASRNSRA